MAHENLKFPLSLEKKGIWQPVFGGQHHGTFYMIYINVLKYEAFEMTEGKTAYKLKCNFRLQNFRGAITIGLVGFKNHQFTTEENDNETETILNFNLNVKPFVKNDYLNDIEVFLEKPIESGLIAIFKVSLLLPPKEIFNPEDLDNSTYINPYTHTRDGDQYMELAFRLSGTNDIFQSPKGMGWGKHGFCLPDVCIFD